MTFLLNLIVNQDNWKPLSKCIIIEHCEFIVKDQEISLTSSLPILQSKRGPEGEVTGSRPGSSWESLGLDTLASLGNLGWLCEPTLRVPSETQIKLAAWLLPPPFLHSSMRLVLKNSHSEDPLAASKDDSEVRG